VTLFWGVIKQTAHQYSRSNLSVQRQYIEYLDEFGGAGSKMMGKNCYNLYGLNTDLACFSICTKDNH